MSEAGATDDQLISVSGHKDRQMLYVYSIAGIKQAIAGMSLRWKYRQDEKAAEAYDVEDAA
jgi:hypothetical protein